MPNNDAYNPKGGGIESEVVLAATNNLLGYMLGDPEKLSKLENLYNARGKEAIIAHSRFNNMVKSIGKMLEKLLFVRHLDVSELAGKLVDIHKLSGVEPWLFMEGCYQIEEYVREHHQDVQSSFLENIRSLSCNIMRLYYDDLQYTREKLKDTSSYWHGVFKWASEPMGVFDAEGRVYDVNEAALRTIGLSREEICSTGFNWASIIDPEHLEVAMEKLKDLFVTRNPQRFELNFIRKDGTRILAVISYNIMARMRGWSTDRLLCTITDLTTVKRQQEYLSKVLDTLPIGYFTCDVDSGLIFDSNPIFCDMLGYSLEELRKLSWVADLTHENYAEKELEASRSWFMFGKTKTFVKEKIFKRKDGNEVPASIRVSSVFDPGLKRKVLCVFAVDLREIKAKEKFLTNILDITQEGIVIEDSKGKLYFTNNAYCQLVSRSREYLLEHGWKGVTEAKESFDSLRAIEEGTSKMEKLEKKYIKPDGAEIIARVVYKPIEYKGKNLVLASVSNITNLKKAQSKLEEILQFQKETIKELSTPIIPIWEKILMAPLIGSFDSFRMLDLQENLLNAVASQRPKAIVIDLSGLLYTDTYIVGDMLKLVSSLKLLGTHAILAGINPRLARQLVHIGANLEGIPTYSTLEYALRRAIG